MTFMCGDKHTIFISIGKQGMLCKTHIFYLPIWIRVADRFMS